MKNDYYFINSHENSNSIVNELEINDELYNTIKSNFVWYEYERYWYTYQKREPTEISTLHNNYLFKNSIKQMSISKENNNIWTFNVMYCNNSIRKKNMWRWINE